MDGMNGARNVVHEVVASSPMAGVMQTLPKRHDCNCELTNMFYSDYSFQQFLMEQRCNRMALRSFVDKSLVYNKDAEWLFILTFPNGGSTALAKLLLTAPATVALTKNAEGQRLIPSLFRRKTRWDESYSVWRRKIRAVWLNKVNQQISNPIRPVLVIEKSPPNMCRYKDIITAFSTMKTYLVTFSRDPYATCASWHRRYDSGRIIKAWYPSKKPGRLGQNEYFRFLGKFWLKLGNNLLNAREDAVLNIRYEDFADRTGEIITELGSCIPQLEHVAPGARVKVKDYGERGIVNMNASQTRELSDKQINAISSALSEEPDTVKGLGYTIL